MGQSQQGSRPGSEGAAGEQHRDDFSAPEAGPQCEGGEQDFQQKGPRNLVSGQQAPDDPVSRAVVGLIPHQEGESQHQGAPHRRPENGVGKVFGVEPGRGVHHGAEEDGQHRAHHPHGGRLEDGNGRQAHDVVDGVAVDGMDIESVGHQGRRVGMDTALKIFVSRSYQHSDNRFQCPVLLCHLRVLLLRGLQFSQSDY